MSAPGEPGAAALRELVLPVIVVAASDGAATACATSTTSYVSLSPPVLSVALRPGSRTAQMVTRTGQFSVSVLAASQLDLAERAGRRSAATDKMADLDVPAEPPPGAAGPPGVAGSAAVLWCEVTSVTPAGDHLVIFGRVAQYRNEPADQALLLRHHRRYLATGEPLSDYAPEGYPV